MSSTYSNLTDSSLSKVEKVRQETAELKRKLQLFQEENFGDEDDEVEEELSVRDTPCGGTEENCKENIFDRFAGSESGERAVLSSEKQQETQNRSKTHPSTTSSGSRRSSSKGSSINYMTSMTPKSSGLTLLSSSINTLELGKEFPDDVFRQKDRSKAPVSRTPASTKSAIRSSSLVIAPSIATSAERAKPCLPVPSSSTTSMQDSKRASTKRRTVTEGGVADKHVSKNVSVQPAPANIELMGNNNNEQNIEVVASEGERSFSKRKLQTFVINGKEYSVLNIIGKGGSSMVYEAVDSGGMKVVAVKKVDLEGADTDARKAFLNEIKLLERLRTTNRVVHLWDFEHRERDKILYVVMEKGETDFSTHLKRRRKEPKFENLVPAYWQEMLLAVQVIHKEGIVHSDLKPANFLLVGGTFKLIDFGIARTVPKDVTSVTMNCQMGTLNYMSPETMNNISSGGGGDFKYKIPLKSDVWSLGCILYSMVYGKTPFQHITNNFQKMLAIMGGNPGRPYNIEFPPVDDRGQPVDKQLMDVMKRCLSRSVNSRPSVDELLDHPYLQNRKQPVTAEEGDKKFGADLELFQSLAATAWQNSPGTNDRMVKRLLGHLQQQKIS